MKKLFLVLLILIYANIGYGKITMNFYYSMSKDSYNKLDWSTDDLNAPTS